MNFKTVHILSYLVGLFFALEPSYIHPDEHFQSMEILAHRILGTRGTIPWEFEPEHAARSFVPLYVVYGPAFYFFRMFWGTSASSGIALMYLVRLQNYVVFTCIYKLALQFLLRSKLDRAKANFYISTSYIAWTYQTHSFSNSMETCVLLTVLSLFQVLTLDSRNPKYNHYKTSIFMAIAIAFGLFNRITFAGFIALPALLPFYKFYMGHLRSLLVFITAFSLSCMAFIYIDTKLYGTSRWSVTPLNNLRYNLNASNLALHGIHSRYTHLFVNLPQMVGPLVIYFVAIKQKVTMPFLSCISGLLILSLFQHQELRFLVPLMPLFCSSIDLSKYRNALVTKYVTVVWLAFNAIFGLFMGSLHQRGVITAIQNMTKEEGPVGVDIWWKTYSPPTWLYANRDLIVSTTNIEGDLESLDLVDFTITKDHVVDLKGCDYDLFESAILGFLKSEPTSIRLIIPKSTNKFLTEFKNSHSEIDIQTKWETYFNIDMDHLDFSDLSTLTPGITMYAISML
ncbi:LADA_0G14378g1_1 [Lachancea dasiensis]|uniref:Mannosyltransferase n=1 Tax=Lachancea dasiensis TaxID=1072105 RepID=A0A1G4JW61_9SACH|nr:LADA_0G14378g1_1 [Lachancea dasiensis]